MKLCIVIQMKLNSLMFVAFKIGLPPQKRLAHLLKTPNLNE